MNLFEQVALGWQCLWQIRREALRAQLWGPWCVLLLAQVLVVVALAGAAHPLVSFGMAPLLRWATHEDVVRYPELFRRLPALASHGAAALGWVLGSLVAGVATRQFAERFRGSRVPAAKAWGEVLPRWPALLLAALPVALVGWGVQVLPAAMAGVRMSSITRNLLPVLLAGVGLVVTAMLLYTTALVVIERRNAFAALREVPRTWAIGFLPGLVVVVLASLMRLPLDRLALATGMIVDKGVPELAAVLALGQAVLGAFTGFLQTGAGTLVYLSAVATRDEESW